MQQISGLDTDIRKLQRCATRLKDLDAVIGLKLVLPKAAPVEHFDGAANPMAFPIGGLMEGLMSTFIRKAPPSEDFHFNITEVEALQILGVIVAHKEAARMHHIKQLADAGISISL